MLTIFSCPSSASILSNRDRSDGPHREPRPLRDLGHSWEKQGSSTDLSVFENPPRLNHPMKRIVTLRQTEILLWLLIFRISMDIFMILKNQKWLSIDEATIGTIAMDILQKGVHPLYFYV